VLNYNYGFWRMTQLFNRSLFIKYYKQDELKEIKRIKKEGIKLFGFNGEQEGDIDEVDDN
jgi:hypothetical protein